MQRIITFCEEQHMFEEGDGIILGLSGGADSVCLLMALLELRKKWKLRLLAVHVHHGIRGAHADRDAAFARDLCERYYVEYAEERADIPDMAKKLHMTEEEAGRHARYCCFYRLLTERGYQKIAVAHHKNDQAETVLFRMARGTGIDGMTGMGPVTGEVIRPLLTLSRVEIEEILARRNEMYCIDATNADTTYTRNFIRHEVIPRLEQINTEAVSHIAALADRCRVMQDYLQESVEKEFLACRIMGNDAGITLSLDRLLNMHPYMRQAVIRQGIIALTKSLRDIEEVHVEAVLRLTESQPGKRQMLPYGIVVWRGADELYFQQTDSEKSQPALQEAQCINKCINIRELEIGVQYTFPVSGQDGEVSFSDIISEDGEVSFSHISSEDCVVLTVRVLEGKPEIIGKKRYTKYFDCDKIKGNLVLRHPEPEDYLVIDSAGHHKRLNRYFVDEKIPVYERENRLVLADGNHILWVLGYRISEAYKVAEETQRVAEFSLIPSC